MPKAGHLAACLVIGGLSLSPAMAIERNGTTTTEFAGKRSIHRFTTRFEPKTGAFTREGTITLDSGRTITYRLSGACRRGEGCTWSADGKGPFGGSWTGGGKLVRTSPTADLFEQELVGPGGIVFRVRREVDGDAIPGLDDVLEEWRK
jgi:hypothetical protein